MIELIQPYVGEALTGLLGGFVAWIFTRKKTNAEVDTTEIDNGDKVIKRYKDALDDLEVRYEKKYLHLEQMSRNIESLFEKKEQVLAQEITYHKKQAALYKKMYDDKVREFNKYKKEHP